MHHLGTEGLRSGAELILVTSLTRKGVEACADLIYASGIRKIYVDAPPEACLAQGNKVLNYVLGPVKVLAASGVEVVCVGERGELERRAGVAAELAREVIRFKVFGRFDEEAWGKVFSRVKRVAKVPGPLVKFGAVRAGDDAVYCGTPPTPLDIAAEVWGEVGREERRSLAELVVRYVDELVSSLTVDEALHRFYARYGDEVRRLARRLGIALS